MAKTLQIWSLTRGPRQILPVPPGYEIQHHALVSRLYR